MVRYNLSLSVALVCLFRNALTLPVERAHSQLSVEKVAMVKRSEAGPEIGGANFPDPSIMKVGSTWYAFATRTIGSDIHIQVASSPDFNTWTIETNSDGTQRDALPTLPAWVYASSPNTWAPDVSLLEDGTFVMYYSATTAESTAHHCIGAATSSSVLGPYEPVGSTALICPLSQGGAIDASGFKDFPEPSAGWNGNAWTETTGQRYIAYKIDGNSIGHGGPCGNTVAPIVATPIILQPVAADGVTLQGTATTLLNNNGASDDGIIEAPSIAKSIPSSSDGSPEYFLFFSSGCYTTGDYTVSYATSSSATGPYNRVAQPLFATGDDGLTAPGGADVFTDAQHLLFHANSGSGRALYEAVISINGETVTA